MKFSAAEVACVKKLAESYAKGLTDVAHDAGPEELEQLEKEAAEIGVTLANREAVLGMMEHIGVIAEVSHADGFRFYRFRIAPKSIEVARAIEVAEEEASKQPPRNIVAEIQEKAKSNPIIAFGIIGLIVLTALAALAASILTIIDKWIDLQNKLGG